MFRKRQQRVDKFITTNENMVGENHAEANKSIGRGDLNLLFCTPAEPAEPSDVTSSCPSKAYVSPWERAMKGNQELTATMRTSMPGPGRVQFPQYKSFNRTALPFGGVEKVSQLTVFELPDLGADLDELEPLPSLQADISSRPSFNRTPIGWVCSEDNTHIHMDLDAIPFDGETDDL